VILFPLAMLLAIDGDGSAQTVKDKPTEVQFNLSTADDVFVVI
jgi:hypothetical protein